MNADSDDRNAARLPLEEQVRALRRLALVATRPAGPTVFQDLAEEVARALRVKAALVTVLLESDRTRMRTLAGVVGGQPLPTIEYALALSPCAEVVGKGYCYMPQGVVARYGADSMVARFGLDTYAAFPMTNSRGETVGLVAALDPAVIAGGDADHAEAVLKIAAVRLGAELDRQATEARLRASEEQYRGIFQASDDALVLWNDRLQRVDVNPAHERLYGFAREELLGRAYERMPYPPELAESRLALVRRAMAGETCRAEVQALTKCGRFVLTELRAIPFQHGGSRHVLTIARDITERKAAEQQLREQEQRYRAIFDGSADPMALWNRRLEVVDINRAFEEHKGFARAQMVGRHWSQRGDAQDMGAVLPLIESAFAGRPAHTVHRVTHADGHPIDMELRYLRVRLGDEDFVLGIGRDITERKAAESQLRASEEQYRAIFEASADALMLWDAQLRRVDVNPAHQRIFGYERSDVVGRGFEGLDYPQDMARDRLAMVRRALDGEASQVEVEAMRKDGRRIVTELRTVPFAHRGEPHVLQVARDITPQRTAQAERTALESQLRQAQKMEAIGQLTGGIAHDFNNILTSVIGYLVLAQERAERLGDATLARQLGSAYTAAQRARDLIAQMLAFARRQRGDRRVIALAPVVRQGLALLRSTMPASVVLDGGALPGDDRLPPVRADAVQLEQVLFNLCINARDAMPRGGRITVQLDEHAGAGLRCASCGSAIAAGRWLRLAVTDAGSGIDPATVSRMFEPFFTTKEVGRGSGMGLAMVHGIVHEHDGHVAVDTAPARGARFQVLLPVVEGVVEEPPATAAGPSARTPLRGRVMLVEDEPTVAAFMDELLAGWGLEVVTRRDPRDAVRWLDDPRHAVDLLITDLTMPHLSGLDLAQHASAVRPELPVLLYSGDADAIDQEALRRAGVRAVLAKPIDATSLRAAVVRWLVAAA
jgi:PAS domain S-box-containing protein